MSCNGCRTKVEKLLNEVEGVQAEVTLNPPTATITMEKHVPTEKFQEVLSAAGNYTIEMDSPKNQGEAKSCCSSHKKEHHDHHKTATKKYINTVQMVFIIVQCIARATKPIISLEIAPFAEWI